MKDFTHQYASLPDSPFNSRVNKKVDIPGKSGFSMFMTNARSILKKFDELCVLQSTLQPNIIVITESWLKSDIDSSLLNLNSFLLFRDDRRGRVGGGVCVWCRDFLCPELLPLPKHPFFDCVMIFCRKLHVVLVSLYLPPCMSASDTVSVYSYICDALESHLLSHPDSSIVICGDFNDFNTSSLEVNFDLKNIVNTATRGNNILDKVFVPANNTLIFDDCKVLPPLSTSDHNCVFLSCTTGDVFFTSCFVHDFRRSYVDKFVRALANTSFLDMYRANTIDEKVVIFYEKFHACRALIPTKTVMLSSRDKPWMTPYLKCLINDRWHAFRVKNFTLYNHFKVKIKDEIRKAKSRWAAKCIESSRNSWRAVNELRGTKSKPSLSSIVTKFSSCYDCCNYINEQFASYFSDSGSRNVNHDLSNHIYASEYSWCPLTEPHVVYEMLSKLKTSKSTGSDGIPVRLLKEGALFLAEPLCHIFNSCLLDRFMPTVWKHGIVAPVPKTSPPKLDNLRPITVLPVISKLLEKIVLSSSRNFLLKHIDKQQFGYVPHSSTTSAMIHFYDRITKLLECDETLAVAALSMDFSKAFDTVSHSRLISKLWDHPFPVEFVEWISSYLSNRTQSVRVNNCLSDPVDVTSGVPQGSLSGPLLFIFTDLTSTTDNCIKSADDIVLLAQITHNTSPSIDHLCETFDSIKQKSNSLFLNLNSSKSKLIVFPKQVKQTVNLDVISIPDVPRVPALKFLGVTFTSDLKWDTHISNVLKRCNSRLYALRVLRPVFTQDVITQTYQGIILPLMDYASPVFVSLPVHLKDKLKSFVKRCHRIIHNWDCNCTKVEDINDRRIRLACKLFKLAETNRQHSVHELIPKRLLRSNQYFIEYCVTSRRQSQFQVFLAIFLNRLHAT